MDGHVRQVRGLGGPVLLRRPAETSWRRVISSWRNRSSSRVTRRSSFVGLTFSLLRRGSGRRPAGGRAVALVSSPAVEERLDAADQGGDHRPLRGVGDVVDHLVDQPLDPGGEPLPRGAGRREAVGPRSRPARGSASPRPSPRRRTSTGIRGHGHGRRRRSFPERSGGRSRAPGGPPPPASARVPLDVRLPLHGFTRFPPQLACRPGDVRASRVDVLTQALDVYTSCRIHSASLRSSRTVSRASR